MLKLQDWMREREAELEFVRRAKAGEREAFEALVRLHFARVYRLVHRMVGNPEDAEDLAQEAFVRAWRALALFREEARFTTWLQRIAVHLVRDHQRFRARRAAIEGVEDPEDVSDRRPEGEALARGELAASLTRALEKLPPNLRAPLVLRVLEGREYDEVAATCGVTAETARTQVMKARKLLMRWLAPWLERSAR